MQQEQQLLAAISAAFGNSDPTATAYLREFSASEGAWRSALALLKFGFGLLICIYRF
jgi:hypothetical protein